eukprot:scaffold315_cov251-Pinguiococcus_pyrenoidosus.AAC.3
MSFQVCPSPFSLGLTLWTLLRVLNSSMDIPTDPESCNFFSAHSTMSRIACSAGATRAAPKTPKSVGRSGTSGVGRHRGR